MGGTVCIRSLSALLQRLCFLLLITVSALTVLPASAEEPAQMSDAELRQKLVELLSSDKADQSREAGGEAATGMMAQVRHGSGQLEQSATQIRESLERGNQQLEQVWRKLTGQQSMVGFGELLGWLALMLIVGYSLEKVAGWRLKRLADNISHQSSHQWLETLCYILLRLMFSLVGLALFALTAVVISILVSENGSAARAVLFSVLSIIVTVRLVMMLAQAVLAPRARGIRPLSLSCVQALNIYRWVLVFTVLYALLVYGVEMLVTLGMEPVMAQLIIPLGGLVLNLTVNLFVWTHRHTITQLFSDGDSQPDSNLRQVIVQAWPILVTVWLLGLWMIWSYAIFVGDMQAAEQLTISWWITLLFPLADRLFHRLLSRIVTLRWLQSPRFETRSRRFCRILQNGLRLILVALAIFSLAEGWGYETMAMMEASWVQNLFRAAVDILIIILVAFIAWELIQSAIERRLPEPVTSETDSLDGEGGGAGATRTETLLPLLRSFILAILVVTVVLSVLSSVGVEIGPLLAGAGVVGIAVGFGAQKLVADVISGVFFLLDDAFRRGEYIEAAGMRGTVENISVRSMRLRHHLGAVQTVPYSEIATVRNLSRDWVTMKLEFRLPYDTDVEKVRKIIKKVGLAMKDDEEMGPNLLLPLKSQGVMRVEESALIFRMKFTSKPGEQWVIRREAYRRVKEALENNGIHFAHRAVHVLMPPAPEPAGDQPGDAEENSVSPQLAAASVTSAVAAELKRQDKLDHGGSVDGDDR